MLQLGPLIERQRDSDETRLLAWTLLFEASGSKRLADDWYDSFAEEVVERLPEAGSVPTRDAIMSWLDSSP